MAQVIRRIVSFPPICTHSLLSRALSTLADGAGADAAASASAQVPAESRSYQTAATAPAADPELPSGHELDAALEHAFASTIAHNAATRRAADASIGQSTLGALLAQTQRPISSASTLHRELYTSEEAFQLENTRLFERAWYCVGHISQVARPGDTFPTRVGSQPIFVTRTKKGELKAYYNVCRHRGSKLVRTAGRYPAIVCPYHRWGYALDGRLVATPMWEDGSKVDARTRAAFDIPEDAAFKKAEHSLFPVRVDTWAGQVFVNLSGDAPPLQSYLGRVVEDLDEHPMDELVPYRSARFDVSANWKQLMENFLEYYHLPAVHPALCTVSGVGEHQRQQGWGMYMGFVTDPLTDGGTPVDPSALPTLPGVVRGATRAQHHGVFPNIFWSAYPHSTYTVRLEPVSAGRTIEHTDLLVHPTVLDRPELRARLDATWDFFHNVNSEDVEIVEALAEGLHARVYEGGTYSFKFEEPLHRFHNMVAHMLLLEDGEAMVVPHGDDAGLMADDTTTRAHETTELR